MEQSSGGFGILGFLIMIGIYLAFAYCLVVIAKKTGHEDKSWWGWIPIVQVFLMIKIAGKEWWWFLLMFIPFVGIILGVMIWMGIAQARGKNKWLGLLILVPIINFIFPFYLAFSD